MVQNQFKVINSGNCIFQNLTFVKRMKDAKYTKDGNDEIEGKSKIQNAKRLNQKKEKRKKKERKGSEPSACIIISYEI